MPSFMIRLDQEKDRNRFWFFVKKKGENLYCYIYTTILFGFSTIPFILNYALKHHAEKFPSDECSQALKSNFYVDNLVKTKNDDNTLSTLYTTAKERLREGNFEIQSCNSNSAMLRKKMEADGTLSRFNFGWKKVFGNLYSPEDLLRSLHMNAMQLHQQKGEYCRRLLKYLIPYPLTSCNSERPNSNRGILEAKVGL